MDVSGGVAQAGGVVVPARQGQQVDGQVVEGGRDFCSGVGSDPAAILGIDTQIVKAEKAVAGQAAVKRNRSITLSGGARSVNRDLEA